MVTEFSGGGDLRRSIALLWGVPGAGRRGPKPSRSVDEVVLAAIRLADAEGLPALSMRRVAEALGLSPMSLYT
jgi:AcrR family transcriptional regulator